MRTHEHDMRKLQRISLCNISNMPGQEGGSLPGLQQKRRVENGRAGIAAKKRKTDDSREGKETRGESGGGGSGGDSKRTRGMTFCHKSQSRWRFENV